MSPAGRPAGDVCTRGPVGSAGPEAPASGKGGRRDPRRSVGDEVVRGPPRLRPGPPPHPPSPQGSWATLSQREMNKEPAGPGQGGGSRQMTSTADQGTPGYGMPDSRAGAWRLWAALGRRWTGRMPAQTPGAPGAAPTCAPPTAHSLLRHVQDPVSDVVGRHLPVPVYQAAPPAALTR